jgi:hypothetical protein
MSLMEHRGVCVTCESRLTGRQSKFCSVTCKNKSHQSYVAQKDRGLTRKLQIVRSLGGKCSICGYSKNLAAFTFHHTEPGSKEFKLDMRSLSNRTWNSVLKELDKCALVCANCHAELHNPQLNLDDLPHPTTAFAAPFGFVVWTLPLSRGPGYLPSSLYTFTSKEALGSGLPYRSRLRLPRV